MVSPLPRETPTSKRSNQTGVPSSPNKSPANKNTSHLVVKKEATSADLPKASVGNVGNRLVKGSLNSKSLQKAKQGGSIPKAPITRGLNMKMPKNGSADIQARLKKKSPWFASIRDPLHGADCKIPDETGVDTGTVQCVCRTSIVANANGVTGLKFVTPYVNSLPNTDEGVGLNFQYLNTASSTAEYSRWGNGTNDGATRGFELPGVDSLKSNALTHRIVSAGIYVQPETALSNNEGELCLFAEPFGFISSGNYMDYANNYKSVLIPMNQMTAAQILWFPFYRNDMSFKAFMPLNCTTIGEAIGDDDTVPYWNMGLVTTGLAEDASLRVTIVVNYEFVPRWNTLNILGVSPSPVDVQETDLVENWVQDMDVARPVSQKVAASSPSTVPLRHEDVGDGTGFGMFFEVIKELAPLALALL